MSTIAIVMMVISLVVIWGGFVVSILRLPEDESKYQD